MAKRSKSADKITYKIGTKKTLKQLIQQKKKG
jgi:hypothetical protein